MSENLIASRKIKNLASKLLKQTAFLKYFSPVGKVHFVGSFALDVMVLPDIDIHISLDNLDRNKILKLCTDYFAQNPNFTAIYFGDHFNFKSKKEYFPSGFYVGLKTIIDGVKFKIDIWFTGQDDFTLLETKKYLGLILKKPQTKEIIIELKNQVIKNGNYLKGYNGKLIYDAVLLENVDNMTGLWEYLEKIKPTISSSPKTP